MCLNSGDEFFPADIHQNENRHQNQSGAHHYELQKVSDQYRQHAAEDRVERHTNQQRSHHDLEIAHIQARYEHEKLSASSQKHSHVQQSAENDYDARSPTNAA